MNENKENLKKEKSGKEIVALIRIRGGIGLSHQVKKTFELLRLYKQNYCVILNKTETSMGMVNRVKDYITWGEINNDVLSKLKTKRMETYTDREGIKKEKKFFRLHPPRRGFERKGIKTPFTKGGALGYRKDKINDLLLRML